MSYEDKDNNNKLNIDKDKGNRVAVDLNFPVSLALITLTTLAGMFVFQAIKHFILPDITIQQSHIITNIFGAVIATAVAYFVLNRYRLLARQIGAEASKRWEANETLQQEIKERKRAEETLHQRDHLLQNVAKAINYLLTITNYDLAIDRAIETLGIAVGVDRVYIFENYVRTEGSEHLMRLRFEWIRDYGVEQKEYPEFQSLSYDTLFPRWYQMLTLGEPIMGLVRDFPESEQETLKLQGLLSVLVVPMMIGKQCWGFISFGDCCAERAWSEGEITVLTTAAGSIGGAIMRQQMEQALRESEERYKTLFDQAQESIVLENTNEEILDVNRAACQLFGYDRANLLSMRTSELGLSMVHSKASLPVHPNTNQNSGDLFETTVIHRDGKRIPVELTVTPMKAKGQKLFLSIIRDITVRKQTEDAMRQRSRELSLLNHAAQAFNSTLDLDQVLITVLEEVRNLMGVVGSTVWLTEAERGELVCRQASGLGSEVVRGWRLAPGEGLAGWTVEHGESLIVSDTQSDTRHFKGVDNQIGLELRSILSVPLRVKESTVGVLQVVDTEVNRFTSQDLTLFESLAASAAIAIDNARLYQQAQQEILERKRAEEALQQRTIELQARNEELDTFAHTVAHDLKNPASFITGFAKLLTSRHADKLKGNEELLDALRHIDQAGTKMNNIIEELMLLSGLRRMKVETTPLDMNSIVEEALGRLADVIEKENAEVIAPNDWPVARGYGPWVEEVWFNYISNAIKYGAQPPQVELGAKVETNGMVKFWVRDNGSGISEEGQSRLFAPFTRLNQVHVQGHGLGLSIVKRIMEKLEGEVGVKSAEGQGSIFTFSLPSAKD